MGGKEAYCFLWNEDQGHRGANEISTCIYMFLTQYCLKKETTFYSDNRAETVQRHGTSRNIRSNSPLRAIAMFMEAIR